MATDTFTTPGSGTWTAPVGVTSVQAECWGGGGGGGDNNTNEGGGGGGGGYARATFTVVPGVGYAYVIGSGGAAGSGGAGSAGVSSSFTVSLGVEEVSGNAGQGGAGNVTGGAGGGSTFTGGTSTQGYTGGSGGNGSLTVGGGGGSSAGTGSNGNAGIAPTGGSAVTGGGAGGRGGDNGNASAAGSAPGGGGGGAGTTGTGVSASAGADGKVVLTYTANPDNAGFRSPIISSTPSPPPFPGQVIRLVNPYGDPPASTASGQLFQYRAETAAPEPFAGKAIILRPPLGETPVIPDGSASSFHGEGDWEPPFPGAVIASASPSFGISSLPARPMRAGTTNPEPFPGGVLVSRGVAPDIRPPLVPAAIVRTSEPVERIRQPIAWAGVPPRDALTRPMIVEAERPAQFGGEVIARRSDFGIGSLPLNRPMVISSPSVQEPGSVVSRSGQASNEYLPSRQAIVSIPPSDAAFVQPTGWAGVPQRDAPFNTAAIVQHREEYREAGSVTISRPTFGLSPLPLRPTVVAHNHGFVDPGRVLFSRPVEAAPVLPPRSVVVWSDCVQHPGEVQFRRGESAPNVIQKSYLVAGATAYPEVSQPFFGWGLRSGTGAPSSVVATVILYGTDSGVVTLTSTDCEC